MRSPADIFRDLPSSPDGGLTKAGIVRSRQLFGTNQLTPVPREPIWRKFLAKFDEPIIQILLVAAWLSMIADWFKAEPLGAAGALAMLLFLITGTFLLRRTRWLPSLLFAGSVALFGAGLWTGHVMVEGPAVLVAVILATGVSFASETKSDRAFEALNARKESLRAKVLRDGSVRTVASAEVVVGDVVLLEMGDEVCADGVVLQATELQIDQALLTGESEPVEKPERLLRGTQVVDGAGRMLVTEVGDETCVGQIAQRLSADNQEDDSRAATVRERLAVHAPSRSRLVTPLQLKLKNLARLISVIGYVGAASIFLAQLVRGILAGDVYWPSAWPQVGAVAGELVGYFVTMVIIIVVAVPEGLPMSVTVSLALAMRKITRAHALVRQLVACETIGSATVICCDKTGTLTQNQMRVENMFTFRAPFAQGAPDWLVLNAAVNSTAHLEEKNSKIATIGNSTEGALLRWLQEHGVDYRRLRAQFAPLYLLHFSSQRKRMTTVIRHAGRLVALVKGAPEWILDHCQRYQAADGTVLPLPDEMKARVRADLQDAGRKVMRTLAFAHAPLPDQIDGTAEALHDARESLEQNLIYLGFLAIRDPLRADVNEAVQECRAAGIAVKMVTGDNVDTARAIAQEIGLIGSVFISSHFNELSDDDLKRQLPGLCVLARATPQDKYRLVRLLQELGEVVAVTGDGTNDAPALKRADVGLAMGVTGTEVAKEASKIVLLDDAFSTIVRAVHWGRSLYENIQRFIQFQLTINVSALAITFLGILVFNVKAPFTVLQLLWINVIMDTLASIALCSEPPHAEVMRMPPKRRDENILSRRMIRTIVSTGGFFVVVMLTLLVLLKGNPSQPGLLAGSGPWSVETGGNRLALPSGSLAFRDGRWRIADNFEQPVMRGREVAVDFTVAQVSLFFSIYVFFQVWNLINCRSLGIRGPWIVDRGPKSDTAQSTVHGPRPTIFLAVAGLVAVGQVCIVTFGGRVFDVEPLSLAAWAGVIVFTSSVLLFAEIIRRVS